MAHNSVGVYESSMEKRRREDRMPSITTLSSYSPSMYKTDKGKNGIKRRERHKDKTQQREGTDSEA